VNFNVFHRIWIHVIAKTSYYSWKRWRVTALTSINRFDPRAICVQRYYITAKEPCPFVNTILDRQGYRWSIRHASVTLSGKGNVAESRQLPKCSETFGWKLEIRLIYCYIWGLSKPNDQYSIKTHYSLFITYCDLKKWYIFYIYFILY